MQMNPDRFVASIAERDIDLLILEELSVNDTFCEWFCTQVFGSGLFAERVGVWHSVVHAQHGESDLQFVFNDVEGVRTAVLIENKINAPPMPEQGARYHLRGEAGIANEDWEVYRTCVIAPEQYLRSALHDQIYEAEISYERVQGFFVRAGDDRSAYKARIIQEAIDQRRRGYQMVANEVMTQFVYAYADYANEQFPTCCVQPPGPRPAGNIWIDFLPPQLQPGMRLVHQTTAGTVKLMLSGQAESLDEVRDRFASSLPDNAKIEPAAKSAAIVLQVPRIDPMGRLFQDQLAEAHKAMEQVRMLVSMLGRAAGEDDGPG